MRRGAGGPCFVAAAALLLASCGGDSSTTRGAIQVTLEDVVLHVSATTAPTGEVTMRLKNDGPSTHEISVVGGLIDSRGDHLSACAPMALDMLDAIGTCGQGDLTLRIGLHTVNIASRLESHGVAGRVHVSRTVRERLESSFRFEERGVIDLRGRGPITTYYLMSLTGSPNPVRAEG